MGDYYACDGGCFNVMGIVCGWLIVLLISLSLN